MLALVLAQTPVVPDTSGLSSSVTSAMLLGSVLMGIATC